MEKFSSYIINPSEGTVFSKITNKYLGGKDKNGYFRFKLVDDNGNVHTYWLHRLIWEYVNGDIPQGYEIDHIDTNPSNNKIDNLRCVTPKENINNPLTKIHQKEKTYSDETKRRMSESKKGKYGKNANRSKPCAMLDKETNEILEIQPCVMDFKRKYSYSPSCIAACCRERQQTAYGYKWKYIN